MKVKMFSKIFISLFLVGTVFIGCNNGLVDARNNILNEVLKQEPKPFTISFNGNQWSAGTFAPADDWVSIEIKFSEVPPTDKVHFYLTSDAFQKEESWGPAYFTRYPQVAKVVTIDLDDWINNQKDDSGKTLADQGATKITSIGIQAKTEDSPDVKVASAIVTKKDGTKEAVVAVKDWGSTVTEN